MYISDLYIYIYTYINMHVYIGMYIFQYMHTGIYISTLTCEGFDRRR